MEFTSAGRVILVRHAQASFGSANYDQLSERGEQQAQRLAAWLVAHPELNFSHVAAGSLRRHAQTLAAIEQAFTQAQRALPALTQGSDWNEFDHDALIRVYAEHTPVIRCCHGAFRPSRRTCLDERGAACLGE